ncbi:MAG: CDP-diacylglycerol--glycerol-3-phosphate 3-phosphatidyltransferase [Oscillospiraceae bacterium]|nr:CDP-diacylglycerol--glycerol-3-phosphate 3-phosphatidyltransferase [Oscillospiraceae bacterium]
MNTPNKLTVFRAVMVPVFLAVLLIETIPARFLLSGLVFGGLALTDMIDGKMARSRGLITNFGKFLDPLADKVLVVSALVGMTVLKTYSKVALICWLLGIIIILAREFMVSALRLVCVEQGNVIAANIWGKVKTVSQFVAILLILALEQLLSWFPALPEGLRLIGDAAFGICVLATIVSGVIYLKQNAAGIGEM